MYKPLTLFTALLGAAVAQNVTYLFTFGDSYSQTGFEISREKPSAANPFGNPPLPGWTSSGGLNWVGSMVSLYNTSTVLSYNFAYGGATVDSDIIAPYDPSVVSFKEQVTIFSDNLVPQPEYAAWTADSSVVGIWIGVNDIGNSWWEATRDDIYDRVMAVYSDQLQILYEAGLRDFFLLNVPPTNKTPLMSSNGQPMVDAIADFNARVEALLDDFKAANEGVRGVVVDTHAPFNEAINNPQRYGAPDAMCVSQDGGCLWHDDYHPSTEIQRLTGAQVARVWGTPFACVDSVLCGNCH